MTIEPLLRLKLREHLGVHQYSSDDLQQYLLSALIDLETLKNTLQLKEGIIRKKSDYISRLEAAIESASDVIK